MKNLSDWDMILLSFLFDLEETIEVADGPDLHG